MQKNNSTRNFPKNCPCAHLLYYGYAAQSTLSPFLGLEVVWNTLLAPVTLKEELTRDRKIGSALVFCGTMSTSFFSAKEQMEYTLRSVEDTVYRWEVLIYLCIVAAWLVFNVKHLQEKYPVGHNIRGLSVGLTAGTLSGNLWCV